MVDLGFVKLAISPPWIARFDHQTSRTSLYHLNDNAQASLSFFSAGFVNPKNRLEELYNLFEQRYRLEGLHFDDLSEDYANEMLVEIPTKASPSIFQHLFFQLCEDVIMLVELRNYQTSHEDEIRSILNSLERGECLNNHPDLARLHVSINDTDWEKVGGISISLSGGQ